MPFTSQGPGICDPTNTTGSPPWWIPLPFISNTVATQDWTTQLDKCTGDEIHHDDDDDNDDDDDDDDEDDDDDDEDDEDDDVVRITVQPGTTWVKLNAGQYGFYRVNYTEPLWAQLATAVGVSSSGGTVLGSEDVAGLLDDAYQLSRAGQLSITVFLNLIRCVCSEFLVIGSH